jgi:CRISPR/Cas system-associated exonuclease Cas4 (RecB family)
MDPIFVCLLVITGCLIVWLIVAVWQLAAIKKRRPPTSQSQPPTSPVALPHRPSIEIQPAVNIQLINEYHEVSETMRRIMRAYIAELDVELAGRLDGHEIRAFGEIKLIELKSGRGPAEKKAWRSDEMQLIAYFYLAEATLQRAAGHRMMQWTAKQGIVRYKKGEDVAVNYDNARRERLLETLKEMKEIIPHGVSPPDHKSANKCISCGFRDSCLQRRDKPADE